VNRLARHLAETAQEFFSLAMRAYAEEKYIGFYLNGGICIEHLLKARLSDTHPVLIADPKNFETMLVLVQSGVDSLPVPTIRTIGLSECLTRCSSLVASVARLRGDVKCVADYRNGAAHVGLVDPAEVRADLLAVLRMIDAVIVDMNYGRERFYTDHLDAVDIHLDDGRSHVDGKVATAIAVARDEFHRRYAHNLPGPNVTDSLNANELNWLDRQLYDCPACGSDAILSGDLVPEWSAENEENRDNPASRLKVYFLPSDFSCKICGLELRGSELTAADIPDEIILDDVDPEDWLEDDVKKSG